MVLIECKFLNNYLIHRLNHKLRVNHNDNK